MLPIFLLLGLAAAVDVTLRLPPKPAPTLLPASTHATLSSLGGLWTAHISPSNTFVFHNVTPGSYLADVHCSTDLFAPLRVDVSPAGGVAAWETYRGNEWGNKGEALPWDDGVEVRTVGARVFFMERPAFSVFSILKNPMILMGLGTMGIVFGLPYLMDNMDPELRAEFEEHQRQSPMNAIMGGGQAQPMGNFDMAAYLAGSKKDAGSNNARQQGVRR